MERVSSVKKRVSTGTLVKVALLGAISYVLMFLEMPIPGLFPSFLKIDISDIPALVTGLALGPFAGFSVEFIKNFLHIITVSSTGGIGELANIAVGGTFVVTTSIIYRRNEGSYKGLLKGFALGILMMTFIGALVNYFIMLPFYGSLMGMDAIIKAGHAVNPKVNNLMSFVLWFIVPFNLIKGVLITVLSIPLYKKMAKFIKDAHYKNVK